MRIRVSYVVNVTSEYRRAINAYYGQPGLASRKEVQEFLRSNGTTLDDDLQTWVQDEEENPSNDNPVRA